MRSLRVWSIPMLAVLLLAACSSAPTDDRLATDIKAKFYSDAQLKAANLSVVAKNGEITLTGEVPSEALRYQAFKLALDTPGVKKVNDQMTVKLAEVAPPPAPPVEAPKEPPPPVRKKTVAANKPKPAPQPEPQPEPAPAPPPAPQQPVQVAPPPPEPPKPVKVDIPVGTPLSVRLIDSVDTEINKAGETFRASLDAPIILNGEEVIPQGADVRVRMAEVRSAGRMAGRAELTLEVAWLEFRGQRYSIQTNQYQQVGRSEGKRTATTIGATTAAGAIIGAIAGGGKGAAIGAAAGAGAGTAASAATKGQQIKLASETLLQFRLESPLSVTYMPGENKSRGSRQ